MARYKAFTEKFVVCESYGNAQPEITIFTEDKGKRAPYFFDTKAEAVLAIADNLKSIAEAVQRGDMSEDSLETGDGYIIASASMNSTGNLLVFIPGESEADEVTVFNGNIAEFKND